MVSDTTRKLRVVSPAKLEGVLGSGATHGELCVRFASEDIREPIIKDNLLDDDVLRELIAKHRLEEWYKAALNAGTKAYKEEKERQAQQTRAIQQRPQPAEIDEGTTPGQADEDVEEAGSDSFEGDVESVADDVEDVEMADS